MNCHDSYLHTDNALTKDDAILFTQSFYHRLPLIKKKVTRI